MIERVYNMVVMCTVHACVEGYENDSVQKPEEQWADTVLDPYTRWSLSLVNRRPGCHFLLIIIGTRLNSKWPYAGIRLNLETENRCVILTVKELRGGMGGPVCILL